MTLFEEGKAAMAAVRRDVQNLKITKTTSENDNISNNEEIKEVNTKINSLSSLIETETKKRRAHDYINKIKFSKLDSKVTNIATKNSDPGFETLENNDPVRN